MNPEQVQRVLDPPWSRWLARLLWPGFLLVFVSFTPLVWSLATGYLFDWPSLTFQTTAVLALNTTPPGAAIDLNGRILEKTTPTSLERLRPGHYRIRVTLPGHDAWRRTLTLRGGEARAFESILLVPHKPHSTQLLDEAITDFWMEKDGAAFVRLAESPLIESVRGYGAEAFLANPMPPALQGTSHDKVAPDGSVLLRWDANRVWLIGYDKEPWKTWGMSAHDTEIYRSDGAVLNAFWHKDSRNVVVLTTSSALLVAIEDGFIREAGLVYRFTRPLPLTYYDASRGWLFFAEAASPWKTNEYVLKRLELFTSRASGAGLRERGRANEHP